MKEIILQLTSINKSFGPTQALKDVNIDIYRGEIRGLIGENGSGKSTISSIIAGMQPANSGKMQLKGLDYHPKSMLDAQKKGVSMVVQEMGTVSDISIAENIFLGKESLFRKWGLISRKEMNQAAKVTLEKIGIDGFDPAMSINRLDFQERKLIEVAKALENNPEILILDETTTALSQNGRKILYQLIQRFKELNCSVLFITHDLQEMISICDSITVLRDGELMTNLEKADFDEDKIKQLMIGREMEGDYYRPDWEPTNNGEAMLQVDNVTTLSGVKNFSLMLYKGEILGIGGLSHCGMHQLGKAIFGAEKIFTGRIVHVKSGVQIKNTKQAIKLKIGYVSKDRDREALVLSASIMDNIVAAGFEMITMGKFFLSPAKEKQYVDQQIRDLSIKCASRQQLVKFLSGGNKQKVVFGKWVGRESEILILDCPTRGVDIGVKAAMYQLLYEMKKQGKSIIMISEELPELIGMSDRLIILKDGRQTAEFRRGKDVTESRIIDYMI